MFVIDIIVIFNSAFYNDDFKLIDDTGQIAKLYIKGWLFIDVIAVIPFNYIMARQLDVLQRHFELLAMSISRIGGTS